MDIKYNVPIEVTKAEHGFASTQLKGIFAHRESEGKYYIKLMHQGYEKELNIKKGVYFPSIK